MPIKISPAFLLKPDTDLLTLSSDIREAVSPLLVAAFQKEFLNMIVAEYDDSKSNGYQFAFATYLRRKGSEVFQAVFGNQDDYDELTMSGLADIRDFRAVFVRNTVRNETYLLFTHRIPNLNLQETILPLDGVASEYSYWDAGLKMGTVSADAWADRGKAWAEALDWDEDITSQGLIVRFLDRFAKRDAVEIDDADTLKGLLRPNYEEERFRRLVVEHYMREAQDVSMNDKLVFLSKEMPLFVYGDKRDYSKIPGTGEQQQALIKAIQTAEAHAKAFPVQL